MPRYADNNCTTCAAYPKAVATVSSVISLCSGTVNGGAGSVGPLGIGNGTPKIVKSKSGDESSSIGYMKASEVKSEFRIRGRRLRSNERLSLWNATS